MLKDPVFYTLLTLLLLPTTASGEIYRCTVGDQTVFSDSPCGKDARAIEVDPVTVGGQLDSGTDVEFYKAPKRSRSRSESECPFINSTDLKRLTIQNKVVKGMKPADVRRSWGAPSSVSTGRTTQWAYHYPSGSSSYVYFRDGCVSNWNGYYRNY